MAEYVNRKEWYEICRWPGSGGLDMILETKREPTLLVPRPGQVVEGDLIGVDGFRVEVYWEWRRYGAQSEIDSLATTLKDRLLPIGWGMLGRKIRIVPRMRGLFED